MAKEGDYVVIKTNKEELKGLLLKSKNPEKFVIKLSSGYNTSIYKKDILKIEKATEEKAQKELPKIKVTKNPSLRNILIIHTGGTLASKVDYKTGAVSPRFSNEEIITMFPELKEIANIESKFFANIFSEDMNFIHYNLLAKEVKENISKFDGIIITHGTDTLHYTSAALSFIFEDLAIPVILVGAQRSSDRGSSDAFLNCLCNTAFNFFQKFLYYVFCFFSIPLFHMY